MRFATVFGIILIALGAIGLAVGGINYTQEEEVVDIGPLEASVEDKERIPIPPVAGGVALAAGVVLLLVGRKNPS